MKIIFATIPLIALVAAMASGINGRVDSGTLPETSLSYKTYGLGRAQASLEIQEKKRLDRIPD